MRIEHQAPTPDLAFKVTAPLRVVTSDGTQRIAGAWTLRDLDLPCTDPLTDLNVQLIVPFQGVDLQFPLTLLPTDTPHTYSLQNLNGRQREVLALFYNGILSGRMASGDEMITSLDTPLDLVPMEQSTNETARQSPAMVRRTKWVANVAFYLLMAAALTLTAGSVLWDRITQVTLQHARVVAPVEPHLVATPGYVTKVLVAPGDVVTQGQRLIAVSLPEEDADVADARQALWQAVEKVEKLEARRAKVADRIDRHIARLKDIYQTTYRDRSLRDLIGGYDLRPITVARFRWQTALNGDAKSLQPLQAQRADIDRQLANLAPDLRRLRRDLGIAKGIAGAADIFATVSGTVRQVSVYKNQHLPRGHLAVTIEADTRRQVQAWLPESSLNAVHLGMPVDLSVMGQGGLQAVNGRITSITGLRDPLISDAFGLQIIVDVTTTSLDENRAILTADAPVDAKALRPFGAAMARSP